LTRARGDAGQVAGVEVLPFGVLIFVIGSLLFANAWAVVDAKVAVTAAAREATRAYVEAVDAEHADADAVVAARASIDGHGRDAAKLGLARTAGSFRRCSRVRFEATYPIPAVTLPWIGGFGEGFVVRARHAEIVDPFRDDVHGTAVCDG
jgi:hypothetical protein